MIQNDVLDGAKLEGRMEGVTEGKILVANNMKKQGMDNATIALCTGLSIAEIEAI